MVGLLNREIGEYMKRITFRQSVRSIYTETTSLSSYGVTGRAQNNVWTDPSRIFVIDIFAFMDGKETPLRIIYTVIVPNALCDSQFSGFGPIEND
ncbi:hypothetical protein TNCV_4927081 [Trichonephila clavipes]|nr:hypothetical protein TNCV_4927081 [Trichonephila clavipes]